MPRSICEPCQQGLHESCEVVMIAVVETSIGRIDKTTWPSIKAAKEHVKSLIAAKPRSELWGAFGLDLTWTDGCGEIRIQDESCECTTGACNYDSQEE